MDSHRIDTFPSRLAAWLLALLLPLAALALDDQDAADAPGPRDVLATTTIRVLQVIEEARAYVDEDPQRYYDAVHEVIDPFVDFRGFARGVMGPYATSERYRSLDAAGQEKLREQLDRFTETIRAGLVQTYSRGLLAFGGSRVEIDEDRSDVQGDRATLWQLVHAEGSDPYEVVYQMGQGRDGRWQLRNLIVENVNLGQVYRSQFQSAARRYDGDLDQVIDNWSIEARQDG